mmetsp:Transcript_62788/g.147755  ORF Transcript_62788/g.147755 Transcript_62788/m.147755 type:complete len:264 (-) Transcript_62788:1928-2719(-)
MFTVDGGKQDADLVREVPNAVSTVVEGGAGHAQRIACVVVDRRRRAAGRRILCQVYAALADAARVHLRSTAVAALALGAETVSEGADSQEALFTRGELHALGVAPILHGIVFDAADRGVERAEVRLVHALERSRRDGQLVVGAEQTLRRAVGRLKVPVVAGVTLGVPGPLVPRVAGAVVLVERSRLARPRVHRAVQADCLGIKLVVSASGAIRARACARTGFERSRVASNAGSPVGTSVAWIASAAEVLPGRVVARLTRTDDA